MATGLSSKFGTAHLRLEVPGRCWVWTVFAIKKGTIVVRDPSSNKWQSVYTVDSESLHWTVVGVRVVKSS